MRRILGTVVMSVFLLLLPAGGISDRVGVQAEDKPLEKPPKIMLRTQEGKVVDFYDLIKDKIVIINFMYTECKGTCDETTKNLVQVQNLLGKRLGSEVYMFSITLDPKHDSPEVLKKYAEAQRTRPGWTFLTSLPDRADDIAALQKSLGSSDLSRESSTARVLGSAAASDDDAGGRPHSGMIEIRNYARKQKAMAPVTAAPSLILEKVERVK